MNFDVLYSIAIDLINKKRANNGNFSPNDFVCVLMTENNSIFTGMSVSDIKNGKLVSSCAEYETIKIMMSSNETKIKALVTVNVSSLMPSLPCESCKKLIVEVNPENSNCMIMKPDNSFCALKDIGSNVNDDIWGMGWDDNDQNDFNANSSMNLDAFTPNTENNNDFVSNNNSNVDNPMPNQPASPNRLGTASIYTSRYIDNPMPNAPVNATMMGNASVYNSRYINPTPNSSVYNSRYINPIPNSPINQSNVNRGNTSTFQAISVEFNPLSYQPANAPNSATSSTLQAISLKQSNTFGQPNNQIDNNDNSVFKKRLQNIITDDIITEEPPIDTTSQNSKDIKEDKEDKKVKKNLKKPKSKEQPQSQAQIQPQHNALTKKELKAIAKEKKKQAKKNSKILEAMEKQSKN